MGNDLRFAIRGMLKSPLFAAVCILSLGFGIGAASTMFNWMDRVLWRPLPGVFEQERMAGIVNRNAAREWMASSYPDYRDFRDRTQSFSGVVAFRWQPVFVGPEGETERSYSQLVSGNYFAVLGVKAIAGRTFHREEQLEKAGSAPVVVLSERYWARRYGRDPGTVGSTILVNRFPLRVIGIVPAEFQGTIPGLQFDLWIPLTMHREVVGSYFLENRASRGLSLLGRLKPGVTVETANAEIRLGAQNLEREYQRLNEGVAAEAVAIGRHPDGAQRILREPLYALAALGFVMLLLVCANVGNLLLARAQSRRKEFAIRAGLGASRWQITRQIVVESFALATMGTLAGLVMTAWTGGLLSLVATPTDLPLWIEASLNPRLILMAFGLGLTAALLASLAPVWRLRQTDVRADLNESSRGATGNRALLRWRGTLAAAEIALATVALIGGGLFWKSFEQARSFRPGFEPKGVVVAGLDPIGRDRSASDALRAIESARERFAGMPGVQGVAVTQHVPLGLDLGSWEVIDVEGYTPRPGEAMNIWRDIVSPGYFEVLRIPLVAGRDFTDLDRGDPTAERVAIVNETFARRYFGDGAGDGAAVGRRFAMSGGRTVVRIIGVAKDSKYATIGESPKPFFYLPLRQWISRAAGYAFLIRAKGPAEGMLEAVRQRGQSMDPQFGLIGPATLEDFLGSAYMVQRAAASVCSVLGVVSLLLAAMGIYGVMAFAVAARRREIGIRMALGATPGDMLRLLAQGGAAMGAAGVLMGLMGWLALGPLAGSILFGVDARDPAAMAPALALLLAGVAIATLWPAWRASRIDPGIALREN